MVMILYQSSFLKLKNKKRSERACLMLRDDVAVQQPAATEKVAKF